jgi:DNA polymerase III delta prime subunit
MTTEKNDYKRKSNEERHDILESMKKIPKVSVNFPYLSNHNEKIEESSMKVITVDHVKHSEVKRLIEHLHGLIQVKSPIVTSIQYPDGLISALEDLDKMVEMDDIKTSIVQQVRFLIVNQAHRMSMTQPEQKKLGKFNGHMLHTVISGKPGMGKTEIGKILARIWMSLGLMKNTTNSNTKIHASLFEKLAEVISQRVAESRNQTDILVTKLQNIHRISLQHRTSLIQLRRLISKMKKEHPGLKYKEIYSEIYNISMSLNDVIKNSHLNDSEDPVEDIPDETENSDAGDNNIQCSVNESKSETDKSPLTFEKEKTEMKPDEPPIVVVSRNDFVADYIGQTANKTVNLLKSNLGKVIFIDEAYSLYNGEKDSYGMEALTALNKFMSEHPNEIIVIFAGYKELMEETIFRIQPGLQRRCTWFFEIKGYTNEGLAKIFKKQMLDKQWILDNNINLNEFFKTHRNLFKSYGGDTERLVFYCGLSYAESKFDSTYQNIITGETVLLDNIITNVMLIKALDMFIANNAHSVDNSSRSYLPMYT